MPAMFVHPSRGKDVLSDHGTDGLFGDVVTSRQPDRRFATHRKMEVQLDPTSKLCLPRDGFTSRRPDVEVPPYYEEQPAVLYPEILKEPGSRVYNLPPVYVGEEDSRELGYLKESYGSIVRTYGERFYTETSRISNPFEGLGRSVFMNRAGLKLANIDAIWGLTPTAGGYFRFQSDADFQFVDLAGAPGAWTQYLQWRLPYSMGWGMSLKTKNKNFSWNEGLLDMTRFSVEWGSDGTGSLYSNVDSFVHRIKETAQAVDLVVADGGLSVVGQEYRQEFLNTRLIASEAYIASRILKPGGKFVAKIYDAFTQPMGDLLYVIASTFRRFAIFKPMSSRPANSERYIVAQGFTDSEEARNTLKAALASWTGISGSEGDANTTNVVRILREGTIPQAFSEYLRARNKESVRSQLRAGQYILSNANAKAKSQALIAIPKYNTYNALAYWNVPDNQ